MAIPGKKPKPTHLRLIEGNQEHRPINQTVKPKPIMPKAPQWLNPIAKTEWKRVTPLLFDLGLLSRIDMTAFASCCESYAILVQCANYINKQGGYAKYLAGKNSQTTSHLTAMNKAMNNIKAFCAEFGMTPSSRGRITLTEKEKDEGDLD